MEPSVSRLRIMPVNFHPVPPLNLIVSSRSLNKEAPFYADRELLSASRSMRASSKTSLIASSTWTSSSFSNNPIRSTSLSLDMVSSCSAFT